VYEHEEGVSLELSEVCERPRTGILYIPAHTSVDRQESQENLIVRSLCLLGEDVLIALTDFLYILFLCNRVTFKRMSF
jgi:hypothetical protein